MRNLPTIIAVLFMMIISYSSVQAQCKRLYFYEFNDNRSAWQNEDRSATYSIEKGFLYIDCLKKRKAVIHVYEMEIDENEDFEIEASIKRISAGKKNGYGICFGFLDENNHYGCIINDRGEFNFFETRDGNREIIIPWTASEHIKKEIDSTNRLMIVKEDDEMKFYSNGNLLSVKPYQSFFGNFLGFYIQRKQKIAVDYIRVLYTHK